MVGLNNGPMWSLAPIFGSNIGLNAADVGTMMVMMTLGSAALQLPIGRLSDRFDRRVVGAVLMIATMLIELSLWRFGIVMPRAGLYALCFALGAVVSTQYYVLVAYTNDITGPKQAVGIAAVMLFSYCVGAVVGPTTATAVMSWLGPSALHLHDAFVHGAMALILSIELVRRRGAPPARIDVA
jgi:MFS family permease